MRSSFCRNPHGSILNIIHHAGITPSRGDRFLVVRDDNNCNLWRRKEEREREREKLSLFDNKLTTLPKPIVELTSLTELYLNSNQLMTLPDSIAALTALKTLKLYGNKFTTFPDSFAALTALQELDLRHNQLVKLPDSIAALTALKELDLSENFRLRSSRQSSAVEAWLTALEAECKVVLPVEYLPHVCVYEEDEDGGYVIRYLYD